MYGLYSAGVLDIMCEVVVDRHLRVLHLNKKEEWFVMAHFLDVSQG